MKKFTKLFLAFVMAMGALSVFAAEHYVYYDGTFTNPQVWAWNETENCALSPVWPGDDMVKKDGKWYWELPAGKSLPKTIIIHQGNDLRVGPHAEGHLDYVDKATYHQDGTYSADPTIPIISVTPESGTIFKEGESIEVSLTATLDATIYYTTDGTVPTTESAVYTESLELTETTTLNVLAVTDQGKTATQTYIYTKMPNPGERESGPQLNTKYYQVNPNGQVGTRTTKNMKFTLIPEKSVKVAENALKNWDEKDMIAQGVARDICQAFKGNHEWPYMDSYAIYASYDNDYLYLAVQFVYTVWGYNAAGADLLPDQAKPYNFDGRMMWAFDLSPVAEFDGYINGAYAIWNNEKAPAGAKFENGVDAVWIGSSKPSVGTPGFFLPTPDGHASYDGKYCKGTSGVEYGYLDGLISSVKNIYGQSKFGYNPAALEGNTGFIDFKAKVSEINKTIPTTAHTVYEWKFPLSLLGITADYIDEYGIGVMYLDIYGSSPVGGTPYDPSYFDNAKGTHSIDVSTSKEKEDEDKITYAPARIGKLLKPADPNKPSTDTPIEEVEAEDDPAEYFTITGVQVDEPIEGQVIIERRGSKVVKKVY